MDKEREITISMEMFNMLMTKSVIMETAAKYIAVTKYVDDDVLALILGVERRKNEDDL